jgi:hypothetical protein
MSFSYVSGLRNNSFNAIKVFKTKVTQGQRNGKENTEMKYCRWVAGKRLTTGSFLNNLKLEE